MRRGVAVLILLAGCDLVFKVNTRPRGDGGGSDDPSKDAIGTPGTCPPIGTAPTFAPNPTTLYDHSCAYTESTDKQLAVGDCIGGDMEGQPGTLDTPMQIDNPGAVTLRSVRLSPEGDRLLVDASGTTLLYMRNGSRWENPEQLPLTLGFSDFASAPSALTERHIIIGRNDFNPGRFEEWRDNGDGTWGKVFDYAPATFGLTTVGHAGLSSDGRRLVFGGNSVSGTSTAIYYSDRQSTADPFTSGVEIPVVEARPFFPFLADDCGHLYFGNPISFMVVVP
jgi:hypothetical protein